MVPYDTMLSDGVIILRPPRIDDAPALVKAVQESVDEIMPWMDWCTPEYNEGIARPWLATLPEAWEAGTQYGLVITEAKTERILGGTGLNQINNAYRLANVGYWVRSSATGRGIATRAARLAGEFGVKQVGLLRAEIVVAVDNQPSLRVAEKSGAKREGVLRNRLVVREKVLDAVMHSFTPQDFGLSPKAGL